MSVHTPDNDGSAERVRRERIYSLRHRDGSGERWGTEIEGTVEVLHSQQQHHQKF